MRYDTATPGADGKSGGKRKGGKGAIVMLGEAPGNVRLITCLMFEKSLGAKSRWAPYIATLQAENDAARLLAGTELAGHCAWRGEQLREEWREWVGPLSAQL
ncbi:hypothetical protein T484DRAFT_1791152 [Baffinella frigidus]|nr:hypothetical protein T484DRAFT_1791152 [Cryptophyta sp. CCMP2293]